MKYHRSLHHRISLSLSLCCRPPCRFEVSGKQRVAIETMVLRVDCWKKKCCSDSEVWWDVFIATTSSDHRCIKWALSHSSRTQTFVRSFVRTHSFTNTSGTSHPVYPIRIRIRSALGAKCSRIGPHAMEPTVRSAAARSGFSCIAQSIRVAKESSSVVRVKYLVCAVRRIAWFWISMVFFSHFLCFSLLFSEIFQFLHNLRYFF